MVEFSWWLSPAWLSPQAEAALAFAVFTLAPMACMVGSALVRSARPRRRARHAVAETTRTDQPRIRGGVRPVRHHGGGVGTSHVVP